MQSFVFYLLKKIRQSVLKNLYLLIRELDLVQMYYYQITYANIFKQKSTIFNKKIKVFTLPDIFISHTINKLHLKAISLIKRYRFFNTFLRIFLSQQTTNDCI